MLFEARFAFGSRHVGIEPQAPGEAVLMFGYVTPEKSELRMREFETYGAYYCGLCRASGAILGQLPRLLLNYDFVFLAVLLSSLSEGPDSIGPARCLLRPAKKRPVAEAGPAMGHAARMMLLLGYYKLLDDKRDEGGFRAGAGELLLRGAYRRLSRQAPVKIKKIREYIDEGNRLEEARCPSFDAASEPFALLMEEVFDFPEACAGRAGVRHALRRIGHVLGKWIYLIDAFDDLEKDLAKGSYNPLALNYGYGAGRGRAEGSAGSDKADEAGRDGEAVTAFKARIRERVRLNAFLYLSDLAEMLDLLPISKNKGLLENIAYLGLRRKTEDVLGAGEVGIE